MSFTPGQLGRMLKSLKMKNTQERIVNRKNVKRTRKNYCKLVYGEPHSPTVKYEVGRNVTERLSVSGQSRLREDMDGQVQRLVRSEVTEMVDSELAGFRALMRQKEEVTSEV